MGRVKLEIKKIENPTNRQVTYSKRRNGLMKKAYELSVLCDIDIVVIMFSPSGKLTAFSKDDRIEEVIGRYATTPQHERVKRKFENVEYLNKVLQKLNDERGGEPARIGYGDLQSQNLELKASYHKVMQEKNFYEQKARLFAGDELLDNYSSLEHLVKIRDELAQALGKVTKRIGELGANDMNVYRQGAVQQTSAYEMLGMSGREGPSSLNDGSNVASSSDVGQGVQMHGSWAGLQLDNGAAMLSSSQLRESTGSDFEASSSSFYQRRPELQPVYSNDLDLRSNYATKIEDTSQFAYGVGGQGQITQLSNQVKPDNSEFPFFSSMHQQQQASSSWAPYNQL